MNLIVIRHVKTDSLDKDDLEITNHKVVLNGSVGDVKVILTVTSTDLSQLKDSFPIERGEAFDLKLD